jgi:hypothetical protein
MPLILHGTTRSEIRRPIRRRDFRRGLRRFTMFNESQAWYDAHPEEWAELIAMMAATARQFGPIAPLPRYTRATLRGEIFREKR